MFFAHTTYLFEKRHGLPQLWLPYAGTGVGYIHIQVWARRVLCALSHVFPSKIKQAAGPIILIAWAQLLVRLRERVRAPASVPFCLFFRLPFLILVFPFCFLKVGVFSSNHIRSTYAVPGMHLFGTLSSLRRNRFEVFIHPTLGACAVCHASMWRV